MKGHPSSVFPLFGCQEELEETHVADEDLDVSEEELMAARRYERNVSRHYRMVPASKLRGEFARKTANMSIVSAASPADCMLNCVFAVA